MADDIDTIQEEIWKVAGRAPDYEVSTFGRVRRASPGTSPKSRVKVGKILTPRACGKDRKYLAVNPVVDGKAINLNVHRMVAEAFLPAPCSERTQVRHLDGNGHNNALSNLAWGTQSENEADKISHGTKLRGEGIGNSKLKEADVIAIRNASGPQHDIASRFNVAQVTVSRIKAGRRWGWLD